MGTPHWPQSASLHLPKGPLIGGRSHGNLAKQRGLKIHMTRWCDGGRTQRSRRGSLTDTAVKTAKRRAAEATLDKVGIGDDVLENVLNFEYLGSRLQCDKNDQVDIRHRMDIVPAAFGSLSHPWTDHRFFRETKQRLYKISLFSSLIHSCTACALTITVTCMINGFNSRCLHNWGGLPRHGHHICVQSGVGCAEATYALPRPRAAPAPGQGSATLRHRSCEGRHLLSRG